MSCIVQCRQELGTIADLIMNDEWRPVPIVRQHADIGEMRRLFCGSSAPRYLYVVDGSSNLKGIVRLEDVLKYSLFYNHDPYSHAANLAQLAVAETAAGFMRQAQTVQLCNDLVDGLEKMSEGGVPEIAVVTEHGRLCGLLTMVDVLRAYQQLELCKEACGCGQAGC